MGRYKDYDRRSKRGGYDDSQNSVERESSVRPSPNRPSDSAERSRSTTSQVLGSTIKSTGTVKMYNPDKGFGFIGQDDGGKDVFVHATALTRGGLNTLAVGQRVSMQVGQGRKGLEAQTIEILD